MKKEKGLLQKTAGLTAVLSYVLALVCAISLAFWGNELDYTSPVFASVLASFFFFIFVGVVLTTIWKTNMPNLKVNTSNK